MKKVIRECEVCMEQFETYPREGRGRYCSRSCATKAMHGNLDYEERFWRHVKKLSPCWYWMGAMTPQGYGSYNRFSMNGKGHTDAAHRVAYELTYGDIPKGMFVCHTCDNRSCVNPSHLFLGTHQDNMRDMHQKGRNMEQTKPERKARGERQHLAKLTEDDVRTIRAIYQRGKAGYSSDVSMTSLARRYHVSKSTMAAIVRRDTWKHV